VSADPSMRRRGGRRGAGGRQLASEPDRAPVWPGVEGARFRPLSTAEEQAVHESVLHLLETLGMSQAIPSMVEKVTRRGGRVTEDGRLLFPRNLVLETIECARRDIVLHGQRPGLEFDLSGARVRVRLRRKSWMSTIQTTQ